jgi:hypothetical protein
MPIPNPKDNEKQNKYMGRCMEFMKDEKYPQKQKVAICLNTYSNPKNKSKAGDRNSMEIDFSDKIKEIKDKKAQEEASKQAKLEPVVEEKIEAPVPVAEVKAPEVLVVEPVHTAVTAPTEAVNEVKVEESKEVAAEKQK